MALVTFCFAPGVVGGGAVCSALTSVAFGNHLLASDATTKWRLQVIVAALEYYTSQTRRHRDDNFAASQEAVYDTS